MPDKAALSRCTPHRRTARKNSTGSMQVMGTTNTVSQNDGDRATAPNDWYRSVDNSTGTAL
jgi:hypothetical protein